MIEWRREICPDCFGEREREWIVKIIHKGAPIPSGYQVEKRGNTWHTIAGRTKWTTVCECDA